MNYLEMCYYYNYFFAITMQRISHLNNNELEKKAFPRFTDQMAISRILPRIISTNSCHYIYAL